MFERNGIAAFAMLLFGAISPSAICHAKPADLPGEVGQRCPVGRDGQQIEGFSQRPDAVETPPPGSTPIRARELPRTRPARDIGSFEEQDAPPVRLNYRDPTERRGTSATPASRIRELIRRSSDDDRRQEMLRSTQPLDTLPKRPANEGVTLPEEELEAVQYYEVPPKVFTGPLSHPRYEEGCLRPAEDDEHSWLPAATWANIRAYRKWKAEQIANLAQADSTNRPNTRPFDSWTPGFELSDLRWGSGIQADCDFFPKIQIVKLPWADWVSRSLCGMRVFDWSPKCDVRQYHCETVAACATGEIVPGHWGYLPPTFASAKEYTLEFKRSGNFHACIPPFVFQLRDPNEPELFDSRLVDSLPGVAMTFPAHDCIGRGRLLLRASPMLILVYPVGGEASGFVDCDGSAQPIHGDHIPQPLEIGWTSISSGR